MAADLPGDRRNTQAVPAQRDDPGPLGPVRRGMPGPGKPADLPALAVIRGGRAFKCFGMELASRYLADAPRSYPKLPTQKGT